VPFPGIADEPVDQSKGNKDKFGHNGDKLNNGGDNRDNQVCCPAPSTEGVSCPCPSHSCHAAANIPIRKKDGSLTKKQLRKLGNQVKSATKTPQIGAKYGVVEVFCPPRFVPEVEKMGLRWVETELSQHPPELLVVCLPCTNAGGWFHINALRMPIHEVLKRPLPLKKQNAFCERLIRQQLALGGRVLFEHPSPSCV